MQPETTIPDYLAEDFSLFLENMSSLADPENPDLLSNYLSNLFEQLKQTPLLFNGMVDQLAMAISTKIRLDSKNLAKAGYTMSFINRLPKIWFEISLIILLTVLIFIIGEKNEDYGSIIATVGIFLITALRILPSSNKILQAFQQIKFSESTLDSLEQDLKEKDLTEAELKKQIIQLKRKGHVSPAKKFFFQLYPYLWSFYNRNSRRIKFPRIHRDKVPKRLFYLLYFFLSRKNKTFFSLYCGFPGRWTIHGPVFMKKIFFTFFFVFFYYFFEIEPKLDRDHL